MNIVTKNITKHTVLTIVKIIKFYISSFFEKNFFRCSQKIGDLNFLFLEMLKIVRTGYSMTVFVSIFIKCQTLLKPALYITVQNFKKFFQISKKFFQKFPKFYQKLLKCDAMNFQLFFSKFKNCKIDIIFSKILFKISHHLTVL